MDVPKVRAPVWDHRVHKNQDPGLLAPLNQPSPHQYQKCQIILNLKYQAGSTESEVSSTTSQENELLDEFIYSVSR